MLQRLKVGRQTFLNDLISGFVMALITIPGGLANGLLAGLSPVNGLYSMIVGTTVAALFSSSVIMNVDSTSATSLSTFSALSGYSADEKIPALIVMTLMVGIFMLLFGVLKLGFLTRFISNAVMTGFLTGIAVLTILGQLGDLTSYYSEAPNKVFQFIDTAINWRQIDGPALFVGMLTIFIIAFADRTRFSRFSFLLGIGIVTLLVAFFNPPTIAIVGDTTTIPDTLMNFAVPDFSFAPQLILPALAIAVVALVQASGVSQSVPNPDGKYPDASGDFRGQGIANIATGFFSGIPVGGSLSGTTLIMSVGGKSRWANVFTGAFGLVAALLFARLIEALPMAGLAGLLVMAGVSMFKPERIATVWKTGLTSRSVMIVTFVATLFLSIQAAVAIGVALQVIMILFQSSEHVRLEMLIPGDDGRLHEEPAPPVVPSDQVTILLPVGALSFAGAIEFEEHLPDPADAHNAVVIIRLRDIDEVGSTFIAVLDRYAKKLMANGNRLMLAGVSPEVVAVLERTKLLYTIGKENVFISRAEFGESIELALLTARTTMGINPRGFNATLADVLSDLRITEQRLMGLSATAESAERAQLEAYAQHLRTLINEIESTVPPG